MIPLKKTLRNASMLAYMAFVVTMLLSCGDDNEQKPTPEPEPAPESSITDVTITGITTNARVWNKIMLTLDAASDAGIDKFEIKVDGDVVATLTSAPFQFELNTMDLPDGPHMLSITAVDKDGNQKTTDTAFTVQNVLLHMEIPGDFLKNGARGFILLSDSLGKTIAVSEYHAGESLELTAPTYARGTFTLTQAYIDSDGYRYLYTFHDVARGRWVPIVGEDDRIRPTHDATVTFTNYSEEGRYDVSTNEVSYTFYPGTLRDEQDFTYVGNDSEVYIAYADDENEIPSSYLYLPSLVSQTATVDLTTLKPMTTSQVDISAFDAVRYEIVAISGEDIHYLTNTTDQQGTLRYSYPGDAFPNFFVQARLKKGNSYYRNLTEKALSLKMSNSNINISYENNSFTGTITGDADYCIYRVDASKQFWVTYTRPGDQKVIFPEIPTLLPGFGVDLSNSFIEVSAVDATKFDGYDALPQFVADYPNDALLYDLIWFMIGHEKYQILADPFARHSAPARRSPNQRTNHFFPWGVRK